MCVRKKEKEKKQDYQFDYRTMAVLRIAYLFSAIFGDFRATRRTRVSIWRKNNMGSYGRIDVFSQYLRNKKVKIEENKIHFS